MKERICFFVRTEYNLLLSLHAMMQNYNDPNKYEVTLILRRSLNSNRLKQDLDLSFLPCNFIILDFDVNLEKKLSQSEKESLDGLLAQQFDLFVFFQEQDAISIIIINHYKTQNTKIYLYQDGLKPYVMHTMSFSPQLFLNNIKQNQWIKKNGYPVTDYFSFINCNRYGFLKGIDKLFLTFPDAYINWKKLQITKIDLAFTDELILVLKKLFLWKEDLLEKRTKVIFFMNQPLHDDGSFEVKLLQKLQSQHPQAVIYIKYHPSTAQNKIDAYKQIANVSIIDSKIPAELFISQLSDSIILSVSSTSMFIDNPKCKFYYTFDIQENNNIKILKNYNLFNPCKHVISVKTIEEILF